jgi:hypothetical protein
MADTGFTADALENVEDAIRGISTGKRVVQVTLQDRIERYSDAQLASLQKLRDTIRNEINACDDGRTGVSKTIGFQA